MSSSGANSAGEGSVATDSPSDRNDTDLASGYPTDSMRPSASYDQRVVYANFDISAGVIVARQL